MVSPQMLHAPIILLKEGVDTSQGLPQIISNIDAILQVVDMVKTTLGPLGMDKLICDNGVSTMTNDGATVMELLQVAHPAAKIVVNISKAQDSEIGDGTTSVVILAGELLKEAKAFLAERVAPQTIIKGYNRACALALEFMREIEIPIGDKSQEERRLVLERCAKTSLNSKLLAGYKDHFAKLIVEAVLSIGPDADKSMIGVQKVTGGSIKDSFLVDGVAFKKTFSYAGFEQQPKMFNNVKVLLLNLELELKAEKENAEVRISSPEEYEDIVRAEWSILYKKLDCIVNSGAKVVFSRLPIGDLATQYFADRGIFCAGRVEETTLKRAASATGAKIQTTVSSITPNVLGFCGKFEEVQLGSERYNLLTKCSKAKSVSLVLRGGAQQFIDEAERSVNDALMVVQRCISSNRIVGGGGAVEMELSKRLRKESREISGVFQMILNSYARALECIPKVLAANSGLDQLEILNKLRKSHHNTPETSWTGLDCITGTLCDTVENFIWEPSSVKRHVIQAATEAACVVLSVDETIRMPPSNYEDRRNPIPQKGRGMRM